MECHIIGELSTYSWSHIETLMCSCASLLAVRAAMCMLQTKTDLSIRPSINLPNTRLKMDYMCGECARFRTQARH
jgi:hypothetical protein